MRLAPVPDSRLQRAYRVRVAIFLACGLVALPLLFVLFEGISTLRTLTDVENERDRWQRPADILQALALQHGNTVVDLGCGAGYFTLKLAPTVGSGGIVVAEDIRRESLAFLWIRTVLGRASNVRVVLGDLADPRLPSIALDAALIANTYHELAEPGPILDALFRSMKPGGRLVIVDRGPRVTDRPTGATPVGHHIARDVVTRQVEGAGFIALTHDDRFIDQAGDDGIWWLLVAKRP